MVICRKETERQEVIKLKIGMLAGFEKNKLLNILNWAKKKKLNKKWQHKPYGKGKASNKIAKILINYF